MARTAKKPSAKKTTRKTAAAKAPAKKTTTKKAAVVSNKTRDNAVTLDKLYKFNLFAAVANLLSAVLSVIFMTKESLSVVLSYSTKDELASTSASVLGTAYKTLLSVEIRYALAIIFVLSAIFSLLLATKLRKTYEVGVNNSVSALRWVFMSISFGTILVLATMLTGVEDWATLKTVGLLVAVTGLLAWLTERENKNDRKHYMAFSISALTALMAWLPLLASLVGTTLYGTEAFAWYVYALIALLAGGGVSIALARYRHVRDGISTKGYLQLEGKYVSTDFLVKLGTFAILMLALHK